MFKAFSIKELLNFVLFAKKCNFLSERKKRLRAVLPRSLHIRFSLQVTLTSWSKVCRTKEYSRMQEPICLKDSMSYLICFIVLGFTKAK